MTTSSHGIKINVEGALSLGKEVIDTVSEYLGLTFRSSRRSLLPAKEDPITNIVRSSLNCDSKSCGDLKNYLEEYIIILAKTIQNILEKAFGSNFKQTVYEKQLKYYVELIKGIIMEYDVDTENYTYVWLSVLKKTNAKFQELASIYVNHTSLNNMDKEKKDLQQKIILATAVVETNYANSLCTEYNFCMKTYPVTNALLAILEALNTASEEKVRTFIRVFYRALFDTTFFSIMDEAIAHQIQVFLYELADSKNKQPKKILLDLQKILEENINLIKSIKIEEVPYDTRMLYAILSDIDLIYVVKSSNTFTDFLKNFYDWLTLDLELNRSMHKILFDIKKELSAVSSDLFYKLINEVQVFLDMLFIH